MLSLATCLITKKRFPSFSPQDRSVGDDRLPAVDQRPQMAVAADVVEASLQELQAGLYHIHTQAFDVSRHKKRFCF